MDDMDYRNSLSVSVSYAHTQAISEVHECKCLKGIPPGSSSVNAALSLTHTPTHSGTFFLYAVNFHTHTHLLIIIVIFAAATLKHTSAAFVTFSSRLLWLCALNSDWTAINSTNTCLQSFACVSPAGFSCKVQEMNLTQPLGCRGIHWGARSRWTVICGVSALLSCC